MTIAGTSSEVHCATPETITTGVVNIQPLFRVDNILGWGVARPVPEKLLLRRLA